MMYVCFLSSLAISLQVRVMTDMKTVLDVVPYNSHTVKCIVSLESFTYISDTLIYSLIKEEVLLHKEIKKISQPGPFIVLYTVSERLAGLSHIICKVNLTINERMIASAMNGTTVEVVGKCCIG